MIRTTTYRFFLLLAAALFLGACQKVVVIVDDIPQNTPAGQPVYIVGNFNSWDPGDERYMMQLNPDSTYSITLPPGFGTVEYKFTRGDWTTVETDICGYEIANRRIVIGEVDTAVNAIESWNDLAPLDCPRLTLMVKKIPERTSHDDVIAIAGNFNSWSIDSSSILKRDSAGNYILTIDRPGDIDEIEFKLTRGDLSKVESDEFGNVIPNRTLRFGIKDTVVMNIEGWIDRPGKKSSRVVLLVDQLPEGSPPNSEIYLANSLNGWMPGDKNYLFQRNKYGQLFFPLPRKKKPIEFKLTRGNWYTVEVDKYGYDISNRIVYPESVDTVRLRVDAWKDLSTTSDYEVTIVIDQLPATTPEDETLFITGNFNGWNPGRAKNSFHDGPGGVPMINLPRDKGLLEFKITRGSWRTAEVDAFGSDIPNRVHEYKDVDTLYIAVEQWKDLPPGQHSDVTLVIDQLPEDTPAGEKLYLAPDFNGWDPGDTTLVFEYLPDSKPYITVPRKGDQFEYKITRGGWSTVETDRNGDPIDNRSLTFGFTDTVYIQVVKWRDTGGRY